MAALQRALALAEVDGVAMLVGQHLHLDVPGIEDRLLDINFAVTERALGFTAGALESGLEFGRGVHQAHAFSAAAGGSFQHHGIADSGGDLFGFGDGFDAARSAGDERDTGFFHGLAGAGFRSHGVHGGRGGADELDSRVGASLREFRILRKEAVTGVDGIGAGARGDVENLRNIQIRFRRCGRADGIGFIGFAHVERGAVYIGVDDHGGNVQLVAGAEHAHRDLATIGNEDLLEHMGGHLPNEPRANVSF